MRNLLLNISYDGANYHGWQIQKNAVTVQEVFQKALFELIGEKTDIKACSRTDTGVHANEFCVSFKTNSNIPESNFAAAINRLLPMDIAVNSCGQVNDDFHARYSCKGKQYSYHIWNNKIRNPFLLDHALHYWNKLDEAVLNNAAAHFMGRHDFTSFCTQDGREIGDMSRTITRSEVKRDGDMVVFTFAADGFLYNMIRIMTGSLLRVAQGKFSPEDIDMIIQKRDRKFAGPTAPACGLYLDKVFY